MRLENKVAVVTGSNSGIGKRICERFLEEGAKVVFSDIAEEPSEGIDMSSENTSYVQCDVSDSGAVRDLVQQTIDSYGQLDVMVNNAGVGDAQGIADVTDENWERVIGVNLSGTMYGMREAAKAMQQEGGAIINMSSILGKVGFAGALSYCASKGGVVQLTHAGALDLADNEIRVNAIAPGFIKTAMTREMLENDDFRNFVESSTPLGHVGAVDDIANAAVYLASDEAVYVTGEVLYVDGGWTAK
ncbi:MAG: SDR family NAD(P)-dependent oxidoreductase [Candidatus Paceibacterota bacterium]